MPDKMRFAPGSAISSELGALGTSAKSSFSLIPFTAIASLTCVPATSSFRAKETCNIMTCPHITTVTKPVKTESPPGSDELCRGESASSGGESRVPARETIKFGDIPQTLLNEVLEFLKPFSAPITVVERQNYLFPGSCTFVEFEGRHFLFTAAHVWEGLKSYGHIGITVCKTASPPVKICTKRT